ncbi:hypothetical protein [Halobacillus litoralis]|uniref:hypothetical protein n=1 Tax=Halobacillus litoralis TaxID=45668 RepID=UPI001CFC86B2|nr:hypothetical protein [Halobacillus litoralis]
MEFKTFFEQFKERAGRQDLNYLKETISEDLQAREIRNGEVVDYHFEDSISGWKQAFDYFAEKDMEWIYTDHSFIQLCDDEWLAAFWVSIYLEGKLLESSNLFFNSYRYENDHWKLIRTYIEAGVETPLAVKEACS